MSGLINLIKSLFDGILSFIGGLLGSKKPVLASDNAPKTRKSAGYFLELDEAGSAPITRQPDPQKDSETQKSAASVAVAEKPEVAPTPAEKASKSAATNGAATAPKATQAAPVVPVVVAPKEPQSAEFATKYLIPTSNGSRRRPGANMNSYLDMARNMKAGNN